MNQKLTGVKLSLKLLTLAIMAVGGVVLFGFLRSPVGHAATGINQSLNFQGRLLDNTGAVVPDGSYNFEFKIYQDGTGCVSSGTSPCGGALKWTEDWIQTNRVTVKNGYFSVNLGSLTAFGSNINWNQDTLWLSTNVGGTTNTATPTWDGEMTPFKRLASSPYSLNSNALQGLQAINFVQLAQGVQNDTSTSNASIFINKNNSSGTPNILELQKASTDVLTLNNSGQLTLQPATDATTTFLVNNHSNIPLFTADTSNMRIGVDVSYAAMATPSSVSSSLPSQAAISSVAPTGGTGTTYTYKVIAVTNNGTAFGNSAASAGVNVTGGGGAVLSATVFNTVNITAYTNATRYLVYRTSSSGSPSTTGYIGSTTTTSFVDNGLPVIGTSNNPTSGGALTANTTYRYEVSAIDAAGGETPASSLTTNLTTAVTANTQQTINVTWSKISGATSYRIYRCSGSSCVNPFYLTTVAGAGNSSNSTLAFTDNGSITISTLSPPVNSTPAYIATNSSNSSLQVTIGGQGSPTGQLYVSGVLPTDISAGGVGNSSSLYENLAINGRYLYAPQIGLNRMEVFDVSNPAYPVDVSNGGLATGSGNASSTYIAGKYLYMTNSLNVLMIYDITDPALPVEVTGGGVSTGTSSNPSSVYVSGKYAYIVDQGTNKLMVFDVSNPAEPFDVTSGGVSTDSAPKSVYVQGKYAYVVSSTSNVLQIFDISNPSLPIDVSNGGVSTGASSGAQKVVVDGRYAYVICITSNKLMVFDVSNPAYPVDISAGGVSTGASSNPGDITIKGRFAYVTNQNNSKLMVFDISNPSIPVDVSGGGVTVNNGGAYSVVVQGRYAYVGNPASVQTFDIGGTYTQSIESGTIEAGSLNVKDNGYITNDLAVGGGLQVGQSIQTGGDLGVNGTVLIASDTNSTTALQLQNSSGLNVLEVGTTATNSTSTINMISRPSFEVNISGWSKKNGGETTFAYDDTAGNAKFGAATLKVVTAAANTNGAQYAVPLANATTYTFSIWAKTGSGTDTATLGRTENGSNAETGCAAFTITTTWAQFSCSFTTANVGTAVYLRQTSTAINTIYLDGATLVQGSIGLSYDAGGSALTIQPQTNSLTLNGGLSNEIQPWRLNANSLPNTRRFATTASGDGFVYYVGGTASNGTSGAISTEADFAKLNSDGSVGTFSSLSATLPTATYGQAASVYNGFLYLAGGCTAEGSFSANCSTVSSSVYYTQIKPDGTLGKIFTSSYSLPATRGYGAMVATNGYLFFFGGFSAAAAQNTVYTAPINADGSIGPWSSATNNLNTAVYGESATLANGNIILVGGCTSTNGTCTTQSSVVQYTTPTNTGNDSTFSTTGVTALGTATGLHQTVLLNGNLYVIGGKQGSSSIAGVQYCQITLNNTTLATGNWTSSNYSLPAARAGSAALANNGYIYIFGGDNSGPQSTVYYTSGARTLVFGSLDLLGLTNQTQSDEAGGGTLNVGDTKIVGNLRVDNMTTLNNGLMVNGGPLNISNNSNLYSILNISNAVSTTANQNESLLQVRDTTASGNYNFGGLSISGGFLSQQTYFGEEFSAFKASSTVTLATTAAGTAGARGDSGELSIDAVAGNSATGGTDTWTSNAANGYDEINCTSNNANRSVGCLMTNNNGTAGQQYTMFNTGNMPQLAVKFRAGNGVAPSSSGFYYVGLSNQAAAVTTGSANSYTSAIKGVYFSNCSTPGNGTGAVSGCGNTWFGIVNDGATVPASPSTNEVACPATDAQGDAPSGTGANFMFGRIEFRKDTSTTSVQIEYFIDYNVNDGIKETSCGTVTTTGAIMGNTAVGAFIDAHASGASGVAKLDIDYFRLYEDDNIPAQSPIPNQRTSQTIDNKGQDNQNSDESTPIDSTLPLTNLDTSIDGINSLIDFTAATSEDTVFNNDVYVKGTIYANKIVANQIEGMDVITDEINSLSNQLAQAKAARPTTTTVSGSSPNPAAGVSLANGNASGLLNLKTVQAVNLTVLTQLYAKGGFTVDGGSVFNGTTQFKGQVSFNSDAGGTAMIKKGGTKVQIKFNTAYKSTPIITANYLFNSGDSAVDQSNQQDLIDNGYSFVVTQTTAKGFTILLNKPADRDTNFSWLATQIDNPQTTQSQDVSTSGN